MKKSKKREHIINILTQMLTTNIALMTYLKECATDSKSKRICSKSIRQSGKALEELPKIKHIEILDSLYRALIVNKEIVFVNAASIISSKNLKKWDTTEKGFKEFLALEQEAYEQQKAKFEEQEKTRQVIEEAKKQGKKVEMVYQNGKIKPFIVDKVN